MRAFKMLRDVKSIALSTVKNGEPYSRVVDIMHYDKNGIYFIVLKLKPYYNEILKSKKVAITGLTRNYEQVRIVGDVREAEKSVLNKIYEINPTLQKLIPQTKHINTTVVYCLYKGKGEIFDLSGVKRKLVRERFSFGGELVNEPGLKITENCIACGECKKNCSFDAITAGEKYYINPAFCDECGLCYSVCKTNSITLPKGL